MKIIYLTDIHDDLKTLRCIIQSTETDLYILSGDLIYKAFYTEEKLYEFVSLQEEFYNEMKRKGYTDSPYIESTLIMNSPQKYSAKKVMKAKLYRRLFEQASINMKEKYLTIASLLDKYAKAPVIMIPGNYDMDLQYTALKKYNWHKKSSLINHIQFSAYGGAPVATSGIPELLSVIFDEYYMNGSLRSEPRDFFLKNQADVIISHQPAFGTLDKISGLGNHGSHGIRDYIENNEPLLALSGHIHEDYGIKKVQNTYCINPSNFGTVDSIYGEEPGGYFCSITLDTNRSNVKTPKKNKLSQVILHKAKKKNIIDVARVNIDNDLHATETVLNEKEFKKVRHFLV